MVPRETYVLIHVEGFHVLEGQVPIFVVLHQLSVAAQRRAACGQPQREEAAGAGREVDDAVADVLGGPLARLRVRLLDDELHGGAGRSAVPTPPF